MERPEDEREAKAGVITITMSRALWSLPKPNAQRIEWGAIVHANAAGHIWLLACSIAYDQLVSKRYNRPRTRLTLLQYEWAENRREFALPGE